MKLIQSIYKDYNEYLKYVESKTNGNVFSEDILSAAISNIYNVIRSGKKKECEISKKGQINKGYFYKCLSTSIANYHRKEPIKVEIKERDDFNLETNTDIVEVDFKSLNERLNKFSKLSEDNAFHVSVFKYVNYGNVKVSPLSRITGINPKRLKDSKDFMNLIVQRWLKEEQRKQALKDWATP